MGLEACAGRVTDNIVRCKLKVREEKGRVLVGKEGEKGEYGNDWQGKGNCKNVE